MKVTLREITPENFEKVIDLKVVGEQLYHVAPNVKSIAEAYVYKVDIPMAVYADETPVGFVMYNLDYEEKTLWLSRIMIDSSHQGKGYGTSVLELLKEIAMKDPMIQKLAFSTHKENISAIKFYEKFGFVDTNRTDGDEEDPEEIFELWIRRD